MKIFISFLTIFLLYSASALSVEIIEEQQVTLGDAVFRMRVIEILHEGTVTHLIGKTTILKKEGKKQEGWVELTLNQKIQENDIIMIQPEAEVGIFIDAGQYLKFNKAPKLRTLVFEYPDPVQ